MTPSSGHSVMDMLFGTIAPSQPSGTASQRPGQTSETAGFADLLGMLTGLQNNVAELLSGDSTPVDDNGNATGGLDGGQGSLVASLLNDVSSNSPTLAVAPTIIGMRGGLLFGQTNLNSDAVNSTDSLGIAESKRASGVSDGSIQFPKEAVVANPNVLALLNKIPAELPTGRFAVLSSKVTDGALQMEVASQETPNQKITLTIPTALLQKTNLLSLNSTVSHAVGIAGQPNFANRVPLADPFGATERFDELLSKANVTEIEIAPSQFNTANGKSSSPVAVAITAEANGMPLSIAGRMNRNQITSTRQRRLEGLTVTQNERPEFLAVQSDTMQSGSESGKPVTLVAVSDDHKTIEAMFAGAKSDDGKSFAFAQSEQSVTLTKGTRHARSVSAEGMERPAVKMTLSNELPNLSQLEGRTLMIKLEPEYLGPARLHLTMRDDTLSARVIVETGSAKSAVESSLSQLTDQLTKAGIKVDYIDVGVRGGGAQNQFFHRQADWFREQNPRTTHLDTDDNELTETAPTRTSYSRTNYLGADRVNIYA